MVESADTNTAQTTTALGRQWIQPGCRRSRAGQNLMNAPAPFIREQPVPSANVKVIPRNSGLEVGKLAPHIERELRQRAGPLIAKVLAGEKQSRLLAQKELAYHDPSRVFEEQRQKAVAAVSAGEATEIPTQDQVRERCRLQIHALEEARQNLCRELFPQVLKLSEEIESGLNSEATRLDKEQTILANAWGITTKFGTNPGNPPPGQSRIGQALREAALVLRQSRQALVDQPNLMPTSPGEMLQRLTMLTLD